MWSLSMWLRTATSIRPPALRDVNQDWTQGGLIGTTGAAVDEDPPGPVAGPSLDDQAVAERRLHDPQPETGTPIPHRATSAYGRSRHHRRTTDPHGSDPPAR